MQQAHATLLQQVVDLTGHERKNPLVAYLRIIAEVVLHLFKLYAVIRNKLDVHYLLMLLDYRRRQRISSIVPRLGGALDIGAAFFKGQQPGPEGF